MTGVLTRRGRDIKNVYNRGKPTWASSEEAICMPARDHTRKPPLLALWSWTPSFQNYEKINYCLRDLVCAILYGSPSRLMTICLPMFWLEHLQWNIFVSVVASTQLDKPTDEWLDRWRDELPGLSWILAMEF